MSIHHRVQAWLVQRGREQWIIAGGPARLLLCETWRAVSLRYGEDSPPALGCILALVREASRDPGSHVIYARGGWRFLSRDVVSEIYKTEVLALVAALEASP
jgi:hypothetical protein